MTVPAMNIISNGSPADATEVEENFNILEAYCNGLSDGTNIDADAITNDMLADNSVDTDQIADNAVTTAKQARAPGCTLTRSTNQTLAGASTTDVTFTTEVADPDGFFPGSGSTVTIPASTGGVYCISFRVDTDSTGDRYARLTTDSQTWTFPLYDGEVGSGGITLPLEAADTIKLSVYNTGSAANIESARLDVYLVGSS